MIAAVFVVAVPRLLTNGEGIVAGVLGLMAIACLAMAALACETAGMSRIRRQPRVKPVGGLHGNGIRIRTQRTLPVALGTSLVASAVFGGLAWLLWHDDRTGGLLAHGADTEQNATTGLIVCLGAIALGIPLGLSSAATRITLSTNGIRRENRFRIVGIKRHTDVFVPWSSITAISRDHQEISTGWGTRYNLLIRLEHDDPVLEPRWHLDTPTSIALPVSRLTAEPNTLYAAIHRLHTEPESRKALYRADAPKLLEAPPLRQRWRNE
ncbi:hypothetical protein [Rhodococcus rhodnii]|uniref:Uncharacterized protein n=1 Tax=Rhodococcus rhodnii LMG 5362 TaxID=1273125 RepID=R7WPE5_9NOCA|nr:hypothetical protein [Rhodococcus rhodnii]EOM75839.1 hypothetical protein Rrhod_2745 [Rhodococcus rhodnii LMG 5362]